MMYWLSLALPTLYGLGKCLVQSCSATRFEVVVTQFEAVVKECVIKIPTNSNREQHFLQENKQR